MTQAVAVPVPAATVVLLRPGPGSAEVLLIHRPATMAFGPGLHVFPGGRIDPEDADGGSDEIAAAAARALGDNLPPDRALAVHRAAIREVQEEVGVTLAGIDRLVPIAHWTTPSFMPRRFSTWFFVADLPPAAVPIFSPEEVAAHRWLSPVEALEQLARGEIEMWVPTTSVLERLIETGASTAADVGRRIRMARIEPPRIVHDDAVMVRWVFGGAGGLPGRTCETMLLGARQCILVDPGDPSDDAVGAIFAEVERRQGAINAIVLSQTDPDHAAAAEAVAIPLEIPILVAPGGGRHLPYRTREAADGERLETDSRVHVRLDRPGSGRLQIAPD